MLDALLGLRPNQCRVLGKARVLGDINEVARRFGLHQTGPRSRNYSLKMVWAPERKTALFTGANHGEPHRLNDVWEFDLAAMAWVLLYAPDKPRDHKGLGPDASDVIYRDGILMTERGGPAIIGHTWSGLTYDPVRRLMLFMNTWPADVEAAIQRVGGDVAVRYPGPPLWAFEPAAARWMPVRTSAPFPKAPFGGLLEYVPELQGSVWHMNNWQMRQTWLYKADANAWGDLAANADTRDFARRAPKAELVGYHDPKRRLLIARQGRHTFHFDTRTRRWTDMGPAEAVPEGHDARTTFCHDAGTGIGVLFDTVRRELWSYRPNTGEWALVKPEGPPIPTGLRPLFYVDHSRQVLVVIDDTTVWVHRLSD